MLFMINRNVGKIYESVSRLERLLNTIPWDSDTDLSHAEANGCLEERPDDHLATGRRRE